MKVIYKKKNLLNLNNNHFGVMFHHFHSGKNKKFGQGSITTKQFEKIIIFLKKNFSILNPEDWIIKLEQNKLKKKIYV